MLHGTCCLSAVHSRSRRVHCRQWNSSLYTVLVSTKSLINKKEKKQHFNKNARDLGLVYMYRKSMETRLFPIEAIHQRVPLGFNLDKVPSGHVNPFDV